MAFLKLIIFINDKKIGKKINRHKISNFIEVGKIRFLLKSYLFLQS